MDASPPAKEIVVKELRYCSSMLSNLKEVIGNYTQKVSTREETDEHILRYEIVKQADRTVDGMKLVEEYYHLLGWMGQTVKDKLLVFTNDLDDLRDDLKDLKTVISVKVAFNELLKNYVRLVYRSAINTNKVLAEVKNVCYGLAKGQSIVFKKGDVILFVLSQGTISSVDSQDLFYVRHIAPFTEVGENVNYILKQVGEKVVHITTSPVVVKTIQDRSIIFKTENSVYTMEFIGIDIGLMIHSGKDRGVNRREEDGESMMCITPFPKV